MGRFLLVLLFDNGDIFLYYFLDSLSMLFLLYFCLFDVCVLKNFICLLTNRSEKNLT